MNITNFYMSKKFRSAYQVFMALITLTSMVLGLFTEILPFFTTVDTVSAHNLQTKMSYMFFDSETQDFLESRMAGSLIENPLYGGPPDPLLRVGDELGLIIKVVPLDGTTTGVGGHVDFFVPNGVTVVDVGYALPDGSGGYDLAPMKGQSLIAIGDGAIGAKTTPQLAGLTGNYTNINGVTEDPVTATGLHRGTIAGVYGDTGIFYSTDWTTAFGSWQRLTNPDNPGAEALCGVTSSIPGFAGSGSKTITNNSGDVVVPCTAWDAGQLYAWGAKGTTYTGQGASSSPIVDFADGRGNAPWGFASGVAGPESGYAWAFDWEEWRSSPVPPYSTLPSSEYAIKMRNAMSDDSIGPWQRIQYPGSRVSYDQAGLKSTQLGIASIDAGNLGTPVDQLPTTVSQTDNTSPKVIRWAVGQLTLNVPEYVWVKIKVNDTSAILDEQGCPIFYADTFGGDAGGTDGGKDHLWRYYEPTSYTLNGCVALSKPSDREVVALGGTFQYNIKVYNLGEETQTNVFIVDTLPSGVTFVSAVPAQNSGPNPLLWYLPLLRPGEMFAAVLTVTAKSSGLLTNTVCAITDQNYTCADEDVLSGFYPIVLQTKFVDPEAVAPGETVTYTIQIDNIGSGATGSPVRIEEHLDTALTYVSLVNATINGANVTATTTVNATDPRNPIFSVPGNIQAGKSLLLTFTALVAPGADPGEYCNWYTSFAGSNPLSTGSLACLTVAGGKIGDTIWRDWNGDGDQDPGEEGIEGVTVTLEKYNDITEEWEPFATTITDANGNYYFNGLLEGDYRVTVTPPAGHNLTGDPDGCIGDPCEIITPNVHEISLDTDEQYLIADFGYQPTGNGEIGDTVFEDIANTGVYNNGDPGIPGVIVYLFVGDALVATTTTDGDGNYSFTGLAEGYDYTVYVDPDDAALGIYFGGSPYVVTTDNPHEVTNLTGTYLDADFGFWRVEPGSIGDQVFIDNDGDGLYDPEVDAPLAGVKVNLYLDGVWITSTVSAPDGTYLFDNLGPGTYTVEVDSSTAPANLGAVISTYVVPLDAGEDYLEADFPFVSLLTKTVDKTFAEVGDVLTFTLKPFFPGDDLLEDVRIIDVIPTGTTYVAGSVNAGGTVGLYTPIAAVPGEDKEGGPLGTATLNTALTVSKTTASVGETITVTLNVRSSVAVNNVSPTALEVVGGPYTILTGPTATANVPAGGAGVNFVWTVTLGEQGVYLFFAGAVDTTGDYSWPEASSASVLATSFGGTEVVTWSLGSNLPRIPGETLTSGFVPGVYAFRGANTKEFSKYGISNNSWTSKAQPTNGIEKGGSLTIDPTTHMIYALEGNSKWFYSYNIATNTWTRLADTSDNANEGGALQYLEVGGVKYVYALLGNSNRFRRYNVAGNTWTNLANTPANIKKGGALTTDGTYLYALQGDRKPGFYRYDISSNTWSSLTNAPDNVGWGGSLTRIGNFIYAMQGDGKSAFWRYDISANTWSSMASTPANVGDGGALTNDGTDIYALQGKTKTFWRYTVATNTWSNLTQPNFTGNVGQGGALVYDAGVTPIGYFNTMTASPSLVSTGDSILVRMQLESSTAVNDVTPGTLDVVATGEASASCTQQAPITQNIPAGGSVQFSWICTATAGTSPGSLTFSGNATGDGGSTTFPSATTNSVLVSPVLTFQAKVTDPLPASGVILNTGLLVSGGANPKTVPSNTTETPTAASIGDFVWVDLDGDGIQDLGEFGLAGVEVCATPVDEFGDPDGDPICDITDASGFYRIYGLEAGTYLVTYDPDTVPDGYLPTTAVVLEVTLIESQQYNDADFGLIPPGQGSIGDTVWLDANNDGVQDEGELGLPGITIILEILVDGEWVQVATTVTDEDGYYLFEGLVAGDYRVTVDTTSEVSSPYADGAFELSDAMQQTFDYDDGTIFDENSTLHSALVTLTTDEDNLEVDFGYNWSGSIGDYVWYDANADGVQDIDEDPISGAVVLIYFDADGDGVLDLAQGDYEIGIAFTDENGGYLFENLPPGNYLVEVYHDSVEIEGVVTEGDRSVVPTTDAVVAVSLEPGEAFRDADFGYYVGARVEGNVFHDADRNAIFDSGETGLPGITVTLQGTDIFGETINLTTTTDENGHFVFLVPEGDYTLTYDTTQTDDAGYPQATTALSFEFTAKVGEDWHPSFDFGVDYGGSIGDRVWNDANGDGVQDAGELGIPGVTVNLYAADGTTWLGATVTDANGYYLFEGLANGTYVVKVDTTTLPEGYILTGDPDGCEGDPCEIITPHEHEVTLGLIGEELVIEYLDADFGYYNAATYAVSGTVWDDLNGDGVQDTGELGIPGVTVCLYNAAGTTVIACTTTDVNGDYVFPGVAPGDYVIKVNPSTLPSPAYVATYDPDGIATLHQTAISVVAADVIDQDFGYQLVLGSISGTVCDGDGDGLCEEGELVRAGVDVTLRYAGPDGILGTADDVIDTTTTDVDGNYEFLDLEPGLYQVVIATPVGSYNLADADGGNPNNITVNLAVGADVTDRDFELATPSISLIKSIESIVNAAGTIGYLDGKYREVGDKV
ncbi:MAG: DUF11 domain-containing protein, partial [Brevefilum sp.]|nr:DUF11 domain-containing protein [Brevefilum sp.]